MIRPQSFWIALLCVTLMGCQPTERKTTKKNEPGRPVKSSFAKTPIVELTQPSTTTAAPATTRPATPQEDTPFSKVNRDPSHQDWAQFRGPNMDGSNRSATVPIRWNSGQGIIWKTEVIEGTTSRGASSPIVVGDRLFITAFTGCGTKPSNRNNTADLQHHVICLDKHTGQQIWKRTIKGSYANRRLSEHAYGHGYASNTPVVHDDRLFTFFGISGVFAFDLDGNFLWQTDVGSKYHDFGSSASLNVFEDLVLVNASVESQALYALNTSTGHAVWKLDGVNESWCAPVVGQDADGNPELVINHKNTINGLNPRTGEILWQCVGVQDYTVATPIIVDDVCYITGGKNHQCMAVRLGGRGDVTETHKLWEVSGGSNVSSPIYHDGSIYVIATNNIMRCIDAETGKLNFRKRFGANKQVLASPSVFGDHLFVPTQFKGVVVMDLNDNCEIVSNNAIVDDGVSLQASIAEDDNRLYLRTDNFVYCVGESTSVTHTSGRPWVTSQDAIIIPKPKPDIDEKTGRPKAFYRCLVTKEQEILDFMLIPYKSVITEEQTEKSTKFILENHQPFIDLRKEYLDLRWAHMSGQKSDQEFATELADLENRTMQHNYKVRKFIKDMFSKEQMDQHLREAGIIRQKPKKK